MLLQVRAWHGHTWRGGTARSRKNYRRDAERLIDESEMAIQFHHTSFSARSEGVGLAPLDLGHAVTDELYLASRKLCAPCEASL